MSVYRVNKTRDFTVMGNTHLRDKNLSLKAVGLLSKMLSFNDGWQFSTRGLAALCKEGPDAILSALKELEENGYLVRHRGRDDKGRMVSTEFDIYEMPQADLPHRDNPHRENPDVENPDVENPHRENPAQRNTKEALADLLEQQKHRRERLPEAASEEKLRSLPVADYRRYEAIKKDHPDALVCFAQHDYFELYGDDAKKAAPLLSTKLLDKKIRGQTPLPVTGFKQELWVAASKKLWKAGHDVLLVKDGEVFKDLKAADFIPVGAELHIDGILSRVEKVNFQAGRVELANIEQRDHPIPYSESLDYVRSCVEDAGLAIYEEPRKQRKEASRSSVRDKLKTVRKEAAAQIRSPVKAKGKEREL